MTAFAFGHALQIVIDGGRDFRFQNFFESRYQRNSRSNINTLSYERVNKAIYTPTSLFFFDGLPGIQLNL